jgi:hypothetical protein
VDATNVGHHKPPPRPPLRPYDLALQPQRPGELTRELALHLSREDAFLVENRAAGKGLPASLWATIAVEAARSIKLVEASLGLPVERIHKLLLAAARASDSPQRHSRLNDYAHALRAAKPRTPAAVSVGRIALNPGLASATAWNCEADSAGTSLEAWIQDAIVAAPDDFVLCEAAAADEGRQLSEWALVQAARRLRSASTPAQMAGY